MELEAKSRSADSTRRLTLTADKYLPLRYVSVVRGQIATQLDIEFGMTGSELMPNKWRYVTLSRAGGTRESFEANVTHCDIGATVALSQFQLQLTPGTVVVDTRHSGGEEVAVVLQDGTMSSGVKRGKVKNYEELVDAVKPRPSWQLWVLALVLGAMACIGSYVLMARRRRAT